MILNKTCIIPIRKNSKTVKDKNIKKFRGKPLVFHVIEKCINSNIFDKIIISTDSQKYIEILRKKFNKKIETLLRSKKNSTGKASTESVIEETFKIKENKNSKIIFLIQATSPLLLEKDIINSFKKFKKERLDTLFTSYLSKKFIWGKKNKNCYPINYNFNKRPMKQNFDGNFVENGAIYIFKLKNFNKFKNRLHGKIGTYIMPENRSLEVDSKNDFHYR